MDRESVRVKTGLGEIKTVSPRVEKSRYVLDMGSFLPRDKPLTIAVIGSFKGGSSAMGYNASAHLLASF